MSYLCSQSLEYEKNWKKEIFFHSIGLFFPVHMSKDVKTRYLRNKLTRSEFIITTVTNIEPRAQKSQLNSKIKQAVVPHRQSLVRALSISLILFKFFNNLYLKCILIQGFLAIYIGTNILRFIFCNACNFLLIRPTETLYYAFGV